METSPNIDWTQLYRKITDAHERGEVGSARNACFQALSSGAPPPPALQGAIARTLAFSNRNLSGLLALYDDNERMRINTDTVSPAVRLMREEFVDSWSLVLDNTRAAVDAGSADLKELHAYRELVRASYDALEINREDPEEGALAAELIENYQKAIRADSDDGRAYVALIHTLLKNDQETKALQVVAQVRSKLMLAELIAPLFLLGIFVELVNRGTVDFPRDFVDLVVTAIPLAVEMSETEVAHLIMAVSILMHAEGRNADGELRTIWAGINVVNKDTPAADGDRHDVICDAARSLISAHFHGISLGQEADWRNDTQYISRLYVFRAVSLATQNRLRDALSESAEALNLYKITDFPALQIFAGKYKVIKHDNLYYAVPRDLCDFRIISGRVIRMPAIALQFRALVPQRAVRLARYICYVLSVRVLSDALPSQQSSRRRVLMLVLYLPIQVGRVLYRILTSRSLKWARRIIERSALMLLTQRAVAVKVSPSLDDLLSELRDERPN
jgi:hypothetical protein